MNMKNGQDISSLKENINNSNYYRINKENDLINSKSDRENNNDIINNNGQKEENNGDNNNLKEKLDDKKISNLLYLLKQMSDKQLYLLDVISNLQKNSSEQINNLNMRIKNLEEKLKKQNKDNIQENYEEKNTNFNYGFDDNNPNIILSKILRTNNNEELIKCLNEFNLSQIRKLDLKLIEDALMRLCILLTEGFKVHEIIGFIKGILIINKINLKDITKKNLKDIFVFVQNNLTTLKDEDLIDISLIISYLNI